MSAISLKSITGITSITTPAGVDNQLTLHNNNTTEAVKLDVAGNLHFHNHLNITGVSTAANFKTGTSNLHNTGLNIFDLDVDGHANLDNVSIAGVATATTFVGALTGTASGNPTLTSGANNRVITATGANALTGEANLTFDGSNFTVTDSDLRITSATPMIKLNDSSANPDYSIANNNGVFRVRDDTNLTNPFLISTSEISLDRDLSIPDTIVHTSDTNTKIRFPANDTISMETAGDERLRITSDGRIGMHDSSPNDYELDIMKRSTATDANIRLYNNATGSSNDTIMRFHIAGTSAKNIIYFGDGDDSNIGMIRYHHSDDSLEFTTGGGERLRITSTGLLLGGSDSNDNTTLGESAGDSFTGSDAIRNTLIGKNAGTAITSGDYCTALGYNALKTMTTNGTCTAIGAHSLEDSTGGGNTGVGYASLMEVSTGNNNSALGYGAGQNIQAGAHNIAIGRDAMKSASDNQSNYNVVIGSYCANLSTTLYNNILMGYGTMTEYNGTNARHSNVCIGHGVAAKFGEYCSNNVVIGLNAMNGASSTVANMSSLSDNIAIGSYALRNAKTNTNNCIVMGQQAAENAATGSGAYSNWTHNVAIGYRSCREATGGADAMVAVGSNTLENHTGDGDGSSGGYIVAVGNNAFQQARHPRHSVALGNSAGTVWNPAKAQQHEGGCVFVGGGAGRTVTTGSALIAIGRDSLAGGGACTGTQNTAIGSRCLERVTSGSNNCAVGGLYTGLMLTTGDYNNFFGSLAGYAYNVNTGATGDHNNIFGGYSAASANNDHENIFGGGLTGKGANTTYIRGSCYQSTNSSSWYTTSDQRIKKNIVDNNIGLDAIEKIRVRNFEYRTKDEITDFDNTDAVVVKKEGVQLGVIAQEIKDILPDIVTQNTTGAYAVDPDNLTWYLVNAVKELSAEVKSLKAQLNS